MRALMPPSDWVILQTMLIEIFADLICPWSYIGRKRLGRALEMRPHVKPRIRWQAYQLNPSMPREGMDRAAYLITKHGSLDHARSVYRIVEETAQSDGIPIALDRIRRIPSTLDAHRLVRYAQRHGVGDRLACALTDGFFTGGLDIGDHDVLAASAVAFGLDGDVVQKFLAGDEERTAVRTSDSHARYLGLQAVPCFVFNEHYALSGAQDPLCFLPLLAIDEPERRTA